MASKIEVAAQLMEHLCTHDWHGYDQNARWGDGEGYCDVVIDGVKYQVAQGDRDCSSAIISAMQAAGIDVGGATYTGNMRNGFVSSGNFEWKPMSFTAQRGDVYLNEVNHTAMCVSPNPDRMAQFSINEFGGITGGQVGDQTGHESEILPYSDYPWDGILHYVGGDAPLEPDGKPIQLWQSNNSNAQKWAIEWVNDSQFMLRNLANNMYLDVVGGGKTSGTGVWVYPRNGSDAQKWSMAELEGKKYKPVSNTPVALIPKVNGGLRLDVKDDSRNQGATLQVYKLNDTPAQQFVFLDHGDGTVGISHVATGFMLDVVAGGK